MAPAGLVAVQPLALERIVEGCLIVGLAVLAILLGLVLGQECFEPAGLGLDHRPDLLLERSHLPGIDRGLGVPGVRLRESSSLEAVRVFLAGPGEESGDRLLLGKFWI